MTDAKSKRDMIWEMKKRQREQRMHNGEQQADPSNHGNDVPQSFSRNQPSLFSDNAAANPAFRENQQISNGGLMQPKGGNQPYAAGNPYSMKSNMQEQRQYGQEKYQNIQNPYDRSSSYENGGAHYGNDRRSGNNQQGLQLPNTYFQNQQQEYQPRSLENLDYRDQDSSSNRNGFGANQRQASVGNLRNQPQEQHQVRVSQQDVVEDVIAQQNMANRQKKQEYGEYLRMQMQNNKKGQQQPEDRKAKLVAQMENQTFDYFGRGGVGGGGAPLRGSNGAIVATRKPNMETARPQQQSIEPYPSHYENMQGPPSHDLYNAGRRNNQNDNMPVGPSSGNYAQNNLPQDYHGGQRQPPMGNYNAEPNYNSPYGAQPNNEQMNYQNQRQIQSRGQAVSNHQAPNMHYNGHNPTMQQAAPFSDYQEPKRNDGDAFMSKRVTVAEPTQEEHVKRERQKQEMQRALQEQIEQKKRQKEEEDRRRKQEELEEEARLQRERAEMERELEKEKEEKKKKAQIFESANQEHIVMSKQRRNRKIIDDDGPPYNTNKQKQNNPPEQAQPISDNPQKSRSRDRRRPRPDLFGNEDGAQNQDPQQMRNLPESNQMPMHHQAGGMAPQGNANRDTAHLGAGGLPNPMMQDLTKARMNSELNQIRSEIQNQQSILSKQLESIKHEAVNAMEERNKAERELRDLRDQLRHKVIEQDNYRENLRQAIQKNSEVKLRQVSEKLQTDNQYTKPEHTEIRGLDINYKLDGKQSPEHYAGRGNFSSDVDRDLAKAFPQNSQEQYGANDSAAFGPGKGSKTNRGMLNDSDIFGGLNKTLAGDTKMIPLDAFDQKNPGAHQLTLSNLNQYNMRPNSSQNKQREGDVLDKLVTEAQSNRPLSQNQERVAGVRAGINYYNMNHDPKWSYKQAEQDSHWNDEQNQTTHGGYGMNKTGRGGGDSINIAARNVLGGNYAFQGGDMSHSGIGVDNNLYSMPDDGTSKFLGRGDDTMDLDNKQTNYHHNPDFHKALETSTFSYNGGLTSSMNIEKIHQANEARLKQLEDVKYGGGGGSSKWEGSQGHNRAPSRGNMDYMNTPMNGIKEEDDDMGRFDNLVSKYNKPRDYGYSHY